MTYILPTKNATVLHPGRAGLARLAGWICRNRTSVHRQEHFPLSSSPTPPRPSSDSNSKDNECAVPPGAGGRWLVILKACVCKSTMASYSLKSPSPEESYSMKRMPFRSIEMFIGVYDQ